MKNREIKEQLVEISRHLYRQKLFFAADGNLTYRVSDDEILITETGKNKAFLTTDDFATVDISDNIINGNPSSEFRMHNMVYRNCPAARCVIHAHPPTAIAWTIAHPEMAELEISAMSEVIIGVGRIPVAPYARPGSSSLAENIRPLLAGHRVMVLARHGALSWGESIIEASNGMERIENCATILKYAHELGGITTLPREELEALWQARKKLGNKSC